MNNTPSRENLNRKIRKGLKDRHYSYIFLLPSILVLLILTIYPLLFNVQLSTTNWNLLMPRQSAVFVGARNYVNWFTSSDFWWGLRITLIYMFVGVSIQLLLGFLLAFLLVQKLIGSIFVRTAIMSAMVMTPVVVGTAWRLMYHTDGLINYFISIFGIRGPSWLAQSSTVIPALIIVDVWQWTPLVMLIITAGLQSMPQEPFDAAKVDGATGWQTLRYLTLPLLKPFIVIATLFRFMDSFRTFDTIFVMTGGGPGIYSQNLNVLTYYSGFEFFRLSEASSLALICLAIIIFISMAFMKTIGKGMWADWSR